MHNALYIKLSTGELIVNFRPDQDYSSAEALATAAVEQTEGSGKSILGYAIARASDVRAHMTTYSLSSSDFSIAEKDDVPGGNLIFLPFGIYLENIPGDQPVLYGTQPPP